MRWVGISHSYLFSRITYFVLNDSLSSSAHKLNIAPELPKPINKVWSDDVCPRMMRKQEKESAERPTTIFQMFKPQIVRTQIVCALVLRSHLFCGFETYVRVRTGFEEAVTSNECKLVHTFRGKENIFGCAMQTWKKPAINSLIIVGTRNEVAPWRLGVMECVDPSTQQINTEDL